MRLNVMAGLTLVIVVVWVGSWVAGLRDTQFLATLLAVPYAGMTAFLAWSRVRVM